jgi:SRSO17 transposase
VIDETGDHKDGHKTAHVARQYLGNLGKIDNGVVSVTSLWADERVYYPLEIEPYTPESYFAKGKDDPDFRTKLKIALQLVQEALQERWPFRAVVADSINGEDRGLRGGLRKLSVPYVMALKPSHAWWHPQDVAGSLQEVAREAGWVSCEQPGQWVRISRTFRDGSTQGWWALEVVAGPYGGHMGPAQVERAVVATTDPVTLPDATTWYLVTNLPAPTERPTTEQRFAPASLEEVIRLYGLRMWVEQSYKQVKHTLGWSQYQVRSDTAIRRHWQLVCCAFSFCWYHAGHPTSKPTEEAQESSDPEASPSASVPADAAGTGEKNQRGPQSATTPVLAGGPSGGARMVGAVDHAVALLASVVRAAPTTSSPVLA